MSFDPKVIQQSFAMAEPIAKEVVDKFYEILFHEYPAAKPLFQNANMDKQKQLLLESLVFIVQNVENSEKLIPYLKQMGGRHNNYGVKPEHYEWVGSSLLKTFAFFFKDKWNAELQSHWAAAYGVIANAMKEGAQQAQKAA